MKKVRNKERYVFDYNVSYLLCKLWKESIKESYLVKYVKVRT